MKKLELKEASLYLPYSVRFMHDMGVNELNIETINYWFTNYYNNPKLILKPLSDYTEEYANLCNYSYTDFKWAIINKEVSVIVWNDLLKNHYDVFGLIEKGLAIDINTLEK